MEILVFNLETTSLQYKLFGVHKIYPKKSASQTVLKLLKQGRFDNLGENKKMRHEEAIRQTIRKIGNLTNIGAIIHRLVYGGNDFLHSVTIGPVILKKLEQYNERLSAYNKYSILGVKTCLAYFGSVPNCRGF